MCAAYAENNICVCLCLFVSVSSSFWQQLLVNQLLVNQPHLMLVDGEQKIAVVRDHVIAADKKHHQEEVVKKM